MVNFDKYHFLIQILIKFIYCFIANENFSIIMKTRFQEKKTSLSTILITHGFNFLGFLLGTPSYLLCGRWMGVGGWWVGGERWLVVG